MTFVSNQVPSISTQELKLLCFGPGTLKVTVREINGYFVPFIQHTTSDGVTKQHGIVIEGEEMLATVELADVIAALEEIIGTQHVLLTPDMPDDITMH